MREINGADLALAAAEMADSELENAKNLLQVRVIPHLINSIWACGEATRNIKKPPLNSGVVDQLARLTITFPGSVALKAMAQVLDSENIDAKVATEYVEEFGRLSRESLSLLNHYRHVRTSINIYLKALVIGMGEENEEGLISQLSSATLNNIKSRVTPFVIVDIKNKAILSQNAQELAIRDLSTASSIDGWLDEMTKLVSQGLAEDRKSRPNRSLYEATLDKNSQNKASMATHTLTLYSGRFTYFIYKSAIESLDITPSQRYKPTIELLNQTRKEQLHSLISKTPEDTFSSLIKMAAKRPNRTINASSNFMRTNKKDLTQKFDLEGRAFVIETKGNGARQELIEKLMENLKIQFDLKIYGKHLLSGGVEDSQGELRITLEAPKKTDLAQIKRILQALS